MTILATGYAVEVWGAELGRRERKKRETRAALCRAAIALAGEIGLERVTVEQVAAAADVSARTFFNYFASKEEAIINPDPTIEQCAVAALAARPDDEEPLAALRHALVTVVEAMSTSPAEFQARLELINRYPSLLAASNGRWHAVEDRLAEQIAARAGLAADGLYPTALVSAVMAVTRVAVRRWGHGTDLRPLAEQVGEAIDLVGAGMPAPTSADRGDAGRAGVSPVSRASRVGRASRASHAGPATPGR